MIVQIYGLLNRFEAKQAANREDLLTMDIKTRIDNLSEEEAKAALMVFCRWQGEVRYISTYGESTVNEYAIIELEAALKEAQHGHKRTN